MFQETREVILEVNGVRVIKTKEAPQPGEYKPTEVDALKKQCDFRLVSMGKKNCIIWSDGAKEYVTGRQLKKLQAAHAWQTDF